MDYYSTESTGIDPFFEKAFSLKSVKEEVPIVENEPVSEIQKSTFKPTNKT
jgi:hypothetical protein